MKLASAHGTAPNGAQVEIATVVAPDGTRHDALGSVVDHERGLVIGYPRHGNFNGVPHQLMTWDGTPIVALEITGHSRGFRGAKLTHYACELGGYRYSGKGLGDGMSLRLRRGRQL